MLTNVQVLAGATSVARFGDVVMWFETGRQGGGVMVTQLLQAVQGVAAGSVPPDELGARLAAILTTGDASAVPALAVATPEGDGLRVVVHGWGAVVSEGIHLPNGWVDDVISGRRTFFAGRNTVAPVPPREGEPSNLESGVTAGDGVSFVLAPVAAATAAPVPPAPEAPAPEPAPVEPPADEPPPSDPPAPAVAAEPASAPVAWPPPGVGPPPVAAPPLVPLAPPAPAEPQPPAAPPALDQPPAPAEPQVPVEPQGPAAPRWAAPDASPPEPGRLVLDDGSTAQLRQTCVLGSSPSASPAVQTGVAIPLTVQGAGVAPVHVEIRVEDGGVAARDLGAAPTYVLAPGTYDWTPMAAGQIVPLEPGTRIALGQRTIAYEQP